MFINYVIQKKKNTKINHVLQLFRTLQLLKDTHNKYRFNNKLSNPLPITPCEQFQIIDRMLKISENMTKKIHLQCNECSVERRSPRVLSTSTIQTGALEHHQLIGEK